MVSASLPPRGGGERSWPPPSSQHRPAGDGEAAQEGLGVLDALALALDLQQAHGPVAAGDQQLVVQGPAWLAVLVRGGREQRLDPGRVTVLVAGGCDEPGARKRREAADLAVHLLGGPAPV